MGRWRECAQDERRVENKKRSHLEKCREISYIFRTMRRRKARATPINCFAFSDTTGTLIFTKAFSPRRDSRARSKASKEEGDRVSRNDNLCLTTTTNHIEDKAVVRADAEPFRDAETKILE
jgi:hypothetical protein